MDNAQRKQSEKKGQRNMQPIAADTKNYQYQDNIAINTNTGEILDTMTVTVPIGSHIYTPEQQEAHNKQQEILLNRTIRENANRELGNFFFVHNNSNFSDISPATLTRLIYLNTYLDYENNQLMLGKNVPMYRKDLINILGISKAATSRFWNEVSPEYITESEIGLIFTNNNFFLRGKLDKSQKSDFYRYRKFFINGVRKLYKSTDTSNHKHLGYIFKMLPYINIEYNVLCYNPLETYYEKISLMTLKDFCEIIGYNVNNIGRLLSIYKHIRFHDGERFCKFVNDGINRIESEIFINPRVLYSGSDYRKVEVLGIFKK